MSSSFHYSQLESYLKTSWENVHQIFYNIKDFNDAKFNIQETIKSSKKSTCICNIDNNEAPLFQIIKDSIHVKSSINRLTSFNTIGLIEQAITEYFADINFFTQLEFNKDKKSPIIRA
jgi:hypothetical protein